MGVSWSDCAKGPPCIVEDGQEQLGKRGEGREKEKKGGTERNVETLVVIQEEKIKGSGENARRRVFKTEYFELHETENLSHSALTNKFSPVTGSPE